MTRFFLVVALVLLTSCASPKFRSYDGPEVTQLLVMKSERKLYLLNKRAVLRVYDIELGFAPEGHKTTEGDGKTPEGTYWIDRRNPNSAFHLSLGISYPNQQDRAQARARGVSPGGDIFIHGESSKRADGSDWTAGCIAVTDAEMEEIFAMVQNGTMIHISP